MQNIIIIAKGCFILIVLKISNTDGDLQGVLPGKGRKKGEIMLKTPRRRPLAGCLLAPKILAFSPKTSPVSGASIRAPSPSPSHPSFALAAPPKCFTAKKVTEIGVLHPKKPFREGFAAKKGPSSMALHPKKSLKQRFAPKKVLRAGAWSKKCP